jgi:hypothetical protein
VTEVEKCRYNASVTDTMPRIARVYVAWLQRTLIAYGAMVLFGIALVAVQATTQTMNIAEFAEAAVSITGP